MAGRGSSDSYAPVLGAGEPDARNAAIFASIAAFAGGRAVPDSKRSAARTAATPPTATTAVAIRATREMRISPPPHVIGFPGEGGIARRVIDLRVVEVRPARQLVVIYAAARSTLNVAGSVLSGAP